MEIPLHVLIQDLFHKEQAKARVNHRKQQVASDTPLPPTVLVTDRHDRKLYLGDHLRPGAKGRRV